MANKELLTKAVEEFQTALNNLGAALHDAIAGGLGHEPVNQAVQSVAAAVQTQAATIAAIEPAETTPNVSVPPTEPTATVTTEVIEPISPTPTPGEPNV